MNFEKGSSVEYKGFIGTVGFVDNSYITIIRPSVIGNPWPITVIVHHNDFCLINEVPSNL